MNGIIVKNCWAGCPAPVATPACEARIEALEKRLKKVEHDVADNEDEIDRLQGMVENAELGF